MSRVSFIQETRCRGVTWGPIDRPIQGESEEGVAGGVASQPPSSVVWGTQRSERGKREDESHI